MPTFPVFLPWNGPQDKGEDLGGGKKKKGRKKRMHFWAVRPHKSDCPPRKAEWIFTPFAHAYLKTSQTSHGDLSRWLVMKEGKFISQLTNWQESELFCSELLRQRGDSKYNQILWRSRFTQHRKPTAWLVGVYQKFVNYFQLETIPDCKENLYLSVGIIKEF